MTVRPTDLPKRKEILITGDNWMLPGVGINKKKDFKRKERKYGLGQENKKETKILTKKNVGLKILLFSFLNSHLWYLDLSMLH